MLYIHNIYKSSKLSLIRRFFFDKTFVIVLNFLFYPKNSQSAEHLEDTNSKIEPYSASLFKFESNTLKIIVYTVPAVLLICLICVILYIAIRKTNNATSKNNVENPDFYAKNHSSYKREDEQSLVNQEEILNV